jgi:hypothetical protein
MPELSFFHKEAELYEELSAFIQIFKRSITTAELLALTVEKGSPILGSLRSAWEISEELT